MQRTAFWLMSDPLANPQFRRCWTQPPPLERKSPGAPTPGQIFVRTISNKTNTTLQAKEQARALGKQSFCPRSEGYDVIDKIQDEGGADDIARRRLQQWRAAAALFAPRRPQP